MTKAVGQPLALDDESPSRTINETTYRHLRSDLLRCHFAPNARLRFDELRLRYGVGVSPLREAMSRLQSEGLIEIDSHKGARVTGISVTDFLDLAELRITIEGAALAKAIERGDDRWEAELAGAFQYLLRVEERMSEDLAGNDERELRHGRFHTVLVSACGSRRLLDFRAVLYAQAERYRHLALAYTKGTHPKRDSLEEHRRLMAAAVARKSKEACALLRDHLQLTTELALSAVRELEG